MKIRKASTRSLRRNQKPHTRSRRQRKPRTGLALKHRKPSAWLTLYAIVVTRKATSSVTVTTSQEIVKVNLMQDLKLTSSTGTTLNMIVTRAKRTEIVRLT